jgi:hypothetical protein
MIFEKYLLEFDVHADSSDPADFQIRLSQLGKTNSAPRIDAPQASDVKLKNVIA